MSRLIAVVAFLLVGIVEMADVFAMETINLNIPSNVKKLSRTNPAQYKKVRQILDGLSLQSPSEVPEWIQATFDATDVRYFPFIVLATYPPQRQVWFTIDQMRFRAAITLH
jgi:hypothetical protein